MRAVLGVLGVLLVLALSGLMLKKQLASNQQTQPALTLPGLGLSDVEPISAQPVGTVQTQSQKIQQQYKQALDAALQPVRPVADDQ